MSRLLTLLLLYKAGYMAGKYVSIEKEVERTKGAYCNALAASSQGWHENRNDPGPFVRYMLGAIPATYREFEERVSAAADARLTKAERVEAVLRSSVGKTTKRDIAAACPDISQTTIDRVLSNLLAGGKSRRREPALRQGTSGKDSAVRPSNGRRSRLSRPMLIRLFSE